ncbi:MAG TPA: hypothetical protein DEH78_16580 [Solibacterales bacterium]|nr:hypothetical protein [Bryobacterales bacterium]
MTGAHSVRARLEHLLRLDPSEKPRTYRQIYEASEIGSLNYWLELVIAAGIATLGLVLDSPAVVIGAMLVSPLMGPILAAGLALAAADLYLGIRALLLIVTSIAGAIAFSATLVWALPFHAATSEILARTQPNLLDLGVAVLSGLAGSLVIVRGGSGGGITALPGVAIAVALMPPLCTVGFGLGSGGLREIMSGASLLFFTNLAAIIAAAFLVFAVARMDDAGARESVDRAPDRLYRVLEHTALAGAFREVGRLRWRVVMLAVVLLALYLPLRASLQRLRYETVARTTARELVRGLAPADSVVAERIDIQPERVVVRVIATQAASAERLAEAERRLAAASGRPAQIRLQKVAAEDDLRLLRQTLAERVPAPEPPPPPTLNALRADVLNRYREPLHALWPDAFGTLVSSELGFNERGFTLRLQYEARTPLPDSTRELLANSMAQRLGVESITVIAERQGSRR